MKRVPFRPMLAASQPRDYSSDRFHQALRFPVIATPKLDGIRCITSNHGVPGPGEESVPVCRSLKPVPNDHIRAMIAKLPPGLDGEIITYVDRGLFEPLTSPKPFNAVQSDVMSFAGKPLFKYHVFDHSIFLHNCVYEARLVDLDRSELPDFCVKVPSTYIESLSQLLEYEAEQVAAGYEGICFRTPDSPYKHGRSTLREQWLVKLKRFVTEEATIIGVEEEMGNDNPVTLSETGYAERSSHKVNMRGKNRLGALIVKNAQGEFKVGTGFSADQRTNLWVAQAAIIGKTITFKHQPHGAKDLPRIPVFVGFRDRRDM